MFEARRRLRLGSSLLVVAILIAAAVTLVGAPPFDRPLLREAAALRDGWFGVLMVWVSEVGYARRLIPAAAVVYVAYGLALRRWRDGLVIAFGVTTAAVVTRLLKETFERARPSDGVEILAAGFSMPSGHATSSAAFAASLLLATHRGGRLHRVLLVLGPAFALLVGLSRVVLGVHYPSDVVAGFCSGVGVTLIVAALVGFAGRQRQRAPRLVE